MATSKSDDRAALMTAMTTEHFVMQTAVGATINEGGTRASTYLMTLSAVLVAMGFLAETRVFPAFAATVIPAVFMMGAMTVLRMVDIAVENMQAHIGIARIRAFYRTLGPEAERLFDPATGRWPEGGDEPSLRVGPVIGFLTSGASMVAAVNAVVGGAGVALLAHRLIPATAEVRLGLAVAAGVVAALGVFGAFYLYQKMRIAELAEPHGTRTG